MVTPKVQQDSFVVYSMIQTMVYLFKNTKQKIKAKLWEAVLPLIITGHRSPLLV